MNRKIFSIILFLLLMGCSSITETSSPDIQTTKSAPSQAIKTPTQTSTDPFPQPSATIFPIPTPSNSIPSSIQPLSFELLGRPAAYRDLSYHHALWDMQLWHERIYLAHGDYYINSGPLRLIYFDLTTDSLVHDQDFILDEEGMEIFRLFKDALYIPGADATEGWELGNLYFQDWGESWVKLRTIPGAVHVWNVALLDKNLVAIGQKESIGALWVSTDEGLTWKEGPDFQAEGYAMPQSGFVLEDKLYVTTVGTGCLVFDGQTWEPSDCLASNIFEGTTSVQKNVIYLGVVTMAPYWATVDERVHFFDGTSRWTVAFPEPVHDVVAAEGSLFVLTGEPSGLGAIYAAQSLGCRCEGDFTHIVALDFRGNAIPQEDDQDMRLMAGSTPHSLEFAEGRFYVGLADGRFFRSSPYQP